MIENKNKGFSVIELCLLVVVIGIVAFFGTRYLRHSHAQSTTSSSGSAPNTSGSVKQSVSLGIFVPHSGNDFTPIDKEVSELQLAQKPSFVSIIQGYYGWVYSASSPSAGQPWTFPSQFVDHVSVSLKATPMITWEPGDGTFLSTSKNQPNYNLESIVDGSHDSYIQNWAAAAKQDGHLIYVRLMHEMNNDIYPWSYGLNSNGTGSAEPQLYVEAYQHVVNIFKKVGASNVQFVWCIAAGSSTQFNSSGLSPTAFYPGNDYVSWVAIDGYNKDDPWKTFSDIFTKPYSEITAVSDHPVMIAEMASVENSNTSSQYSKATWITQAYKTIDTPQFSKIKAVLYFNGPASGPLGTYDYPLEDTLSASSSISSVLSANNIAAYKAVEGNTYFESSAPTSTITY